MTLLKTSFITAISIGLAGFPPVARADLFTFDIDYSQSTPELNIVRIYAVFNGNDLLSNVGHAAAAAFSPQGFYQHPFGSDIAPTAGAISADPSTANDSYVTIGLSVATANYGTTLDPDFSSFAFNTQGMLIGGWYNTPPTNNQGAPDQDGRVLIAQLSTPADSNPGFAGTMEVYWFEIGGGGAMMAPLAISGPLQLLDAGPDQPLRGGGPVNVHYTVHNAFFEPITFGLEAGLSLGGFGYIASDARHAEIVTIGASMQQEFTREFVEPTSSVLAGPYKRIYAIRDVDSTGTFTDTYASSVEDEIAAHFSRPTFGTTVLTHGDHSSSPQWMTTIANDIIERAGHGSVLKYEPATGHWTFVGGSLDPAEEIVLVFNWPETHGITASTPPRYGEPAAAAEAFEAALRDPLLPGSLAGAPLLESGIHLLGYTRGAIVNSALVRRFGLDGLAINHVTTLIPRAFDGTGTFPDWNDPAPITWTNAQWADNYYQPGASSTNQPLAGAYNTLFVGTPWQWYDGTVDLLDETVQRALFYGPDLGWNVGFFWTDIVGGPLVLPRPPVDGNATAPDAPQAGPPPASIFNGDFELGTTQFAGWAHHGGSHPAAWASDAGGVYMQLSSAAASAAHNRFWIDPEDTTLTFDFRAHAPASDDLLVVTLIDKLGTTATLMSGPVQLPSTGMAWNTAAVEIPPALRSHSHVLKFEVVPVGAPELLVDIDNIALASAPAPLFADLNLDGAVDQLDLAMLLESWGKCPPTEGCTADINHDGVVGPFDLAQLLAHWEL